MADHALLLVAESMANADMFAATRFLTSDPIVWIEQGDRRTIVVSGFDVELARRQSLATEVLAADELTRSEREAGATLQELGRVEVLNAVRAFGTTTLRVPPWFPLEHAEHLRASGVTLTIDAEALAARRRRKTADEVAGLRIVQGLVEQAMGLIRDTIGSCSPDADGVLVLDGAPLTSEQVRGIVQTFWVANGLEPVTPIVAGGAQGADPHEHGSGPLRAGEPIVCDLFPRHATLRLYGDMTRTFCFGAPSEEVAAVHRTCVEAIERAIEMARPGVRGTDLERMVSELFRDARYPSRSFPAETIASASAFSYPHGLGHGVGYAVHEPPSAGLAGHEPLEEGDTLTIEPGLYAPGIAGCRVEDLVVLTADGNENLNRMGYELIVPA
jgi:Xaa-Pro aminopeptidase